MKIAIAKSSTPVALLRFFCENLPTTSCNIHAKALLSREYRGISTMFSPSVLDNRVLELAVCITDFV